MGGGLPEWEPFSWRIRRVDHEPFASAAVTQLTLSCPLIQEAGAMTKHIVNLDDVPLADGGNGATFVAKLGRAGPRLESTGLGCTLTIVPPGKRAWPFHRHHVIHEMFYVLSGTGEYRSDSERFPLRAGDLIAAPAGFWELLRDADH